MLDIKEQEKTTEEINKYHKRIDDLIEDAELEAEIEAEKKIRSKNSLMFSISIIGILLLGLVYFKINNASVSSKYDKETLQTHIPETAEERLAKRVPVLENVPMSSSITVPPPVEPKEIIPESSPVILKSKGTKPKINNKIKGTTTTNFRFFIQAGAFGIKSNADTLLTKLKAKGFSPSIQTRSQNLDRQIVTVGNFNKKTAGKKTQRELSKKGFSSSFYSPSQNSFSLKVGEFKAIKDAQNFQDRLSKKGFLSESHKANIPVKTYIVQLGVFPTREKAVLTQEKLARSGFLKTFLR